MAQHFWLSQRAMRLQGVALEFTEHHLVPKDLAVLIRYQTTNERAFQKDLATLLALKKQSANRQIGSVPQTVSQSAAATRQGNANATTASPCLVPNLPCPPAQTTTNCFPPAL